MVSVSLCMIVKNEEDVLERCLESVAGLVEEIIIGPDSTQSAAILQDYLRDNGLSALAERVSLSECPLRGLAT